MRAFSRRSGLEDLVFWIELNEDVCMIGRLSSLHGILILLYANSMLCNERWYIVGACRQAQVLLPKAYRTAKPKSNDSPSRTAAPPNGHRESLVKPIEIHYNNYSGKLHHKGMFGVLPFSWAVRKLGI